MLKLPSAVMAGIVPVVVVRRAYWQVSKYDVIAPSVWSRRLRGLVCWGRLEGVLEAGLRV